MLFLSFLLVVYVVSAGFSFHNKMENNLKAEFFKKAVENLKSEKNSLLSDKKSSEKRTKVDIPAKSRELGISETALGEILKNIQKENQKNEVT